MIILCDSSWIIFENSLNWISRPIGMRSDLVLCRRFCDAPSDEMRDLRCLRKICHAGSAAWRPQASQSLVWNLSEVAMAKSPRRVVFFSSEISLAWRECWRSRRAAGRRERCELSTYPSPLLLGMME